MPEPLRIENRHTGETLVLLRVVDRDGRTALLIDGSLPPHSSGPPPHVHYQQREEGTVRAGTLGTRCDGTTAVVSTGGSTAFPAGAVHAWWNAGDDVLEVSGRATPALDLDRFLQAVFAVLNAAPSGKPSPFYMAHVLWRHRRTQSLAVPPPLVQRIVLPLVVLLGRVLGRYRGAAWPGSGASCTGAPEATEAG